MLTMRELKPHSLSIVKYPEPILRASCKRIDRIDGDHRELAEKMFQIMYAARGVGLAAPQVGVGIRLFVANPTGQPGQDEGVYVNPEIVYHNGTEVGDEGCLSLPGVACKIRRHTHVRVRAQDLEGLVFEATGGGLLARVFQHEMDHLNGILVVDKMSLVARLSNRRALKELEEAYADSHDGAAGARRRW